MIRKLNELIFLFYLFLLPLFFFRGMETAFEAPKYYLVGLIAVISAVGCLIEHQTWRIPRNPIFYLLSALLLWAGLSQYYAVSPLLTRQGWILLFAHWIIGFSFFQCYQPSWKNKFKVVVYSVCLLEAAFALFQLFYASKMSFNAGRMGIQASLGDWRDFVQGTLGNTDFVAGFLCLLFPAFLWSFLQGRKKLLLMLPCLIIWSAALLVCWSVSAFVSVTFFCTVLWLFQWKKISWKRFLLMSITGICILLFFESRNPVNPLNPGIFKQAFGSERWHLGGPTRYIIWENARMIWKSAPFFGVGYQGFIYQFPAFTPEYVLRNPEYSGYIGQFTNAAHNDTWQFLCELGLVGGILLLFLFWRLIRESVQFKDLFFISFFCMIFLNSHMSFPLQMATHRGLFILLIFWFLAESKSSASCVRVNRPAKILLIAVFLITLLPMSREITGHFLYKQVRNRLFRSMHVHGPVLEKGWMDVFYAVSLKEKGLHQESQSILMDVEKRTRSMMYYSDVMKKLDRIYQLSPTYYDALSKHAQMTLLSGDPRKALELYLECSEVLNTREILWGIVFSAALTDQLSVKNQTMNRLRMRIPSPEDIQMMRQLAGNPGGV